MRPTQRIIRTAKEEDGDALAELHLLAWKIGYKTLLPAEKLASLDLNRFRETWRHNLGNTQRKNLIAVADEVLCGFISWAPSLDEDLPPEVVEITALYCHPDHWRQGHASALWQAGLEAIREEGFRGIALWTWEQNARGRAFYEAKGMVPDTVIEKDRFGLPKKEIRYRLNLT